MRIFVCGLGEYLCDCLVDVFARCVSLDVALVKGVESISVESGEHKYKWLLVQDIDKLDGVSVWLWEAGEGLGGWGCYGSG